MVPDFGKLPFMGSEFSWRVFGFRVFWIWGLIRGLGLRLYGFFRRLTRLDVV